MLTCDEPQQALPDVPGRQSTRNGDAPGPEERLRCAEAFDCGLRDRVVPAVG